MLIIEKNKHSRPMTERALKNTICFYSNGVGGMGVL
jgi:hypothetical protein